MGNEDILHVVSSMMERENLVYVPIHYRKSVTSIAIQLRIAIVMRNRKHKTVNFKSTAVILPTFLPPKCGTGVGITHSKNGWMVLAEQTDI